MLFACQSKNKHVYYICVWDYMISKSICILCIMQLFFCMYCIYIYTCFSNIYIRILHIFILLYPIIPMGRRPFEKRIMQDPLSHSMSFMEETGSRSAMGFTKEPFTHVHGVTLCESSYCIKIVYICSICIPSNYNAILITCWVLYSFVYSSAVSNVHTIFLIPC